MAEIIKSYRELRVYQLAFETAMEIFIMTKKFPPEEKYSLTDQMRRSSRSVCMNIGEAWRKRRYKAAFIAKLSDSETEACETQISLEFAYRCSYISEETFHVFYDKYEKIISQLIIMIDDADKWTIKPKER
ncbi:MAG: four helix bundle protein [Bacteroidia bacterium]|nr:four helix bundle protein [Bacteroidia bacterium]